jgi:hypothetical protein
MSADLVYNSPPWVYRGVLDNVDDAAVTSTLSSAVIIAKLGRKAHTRVQELCFTGQALIQRQDIMSKATESYSHDAPNDHLRRLIDVRDPHQTTIRSKHNQNEYHRYKDTQGPFITTKVNSLEYYHRATGVNGAETRFSGAKLKDIGHSTPAPQAECAADNTDDIASHAIDQSRSQTLHYHHLIIEFEFEDEDQHYHSGHTLGHHIVSRPWSTASYEAREQVSEEHRETQLREQSAIEHYSPMDRWEYETMRDEAWNDIGQMQGSAPLKLDPTDMNTVYSRSSSLDGNLSLGTPCTVCFEGY